MKAELPITVLLFVAVAALVLVFVFSSVIPGITEQAQNLLVFEGGEKGVSLQYAIRQCDLWQKADFMDTVMPSEIPKVFSEIGLNDESFSKGMASKIKLCTAEAGYLSCRDKCAALLTLNEACANFRLPMADCYSLTTERCQLEGCY